MAKFKQNIGSDVMISGDFYELIVAFSLVKKDLQVILANSVAFDILVIDKRNKMFRDENVGISVKGREIKKHYSIPFNELKIDALQEQAKIWNFKPYYAFVSLSRIFFVPLAEVVKLKNKSTGKSLSLKKINQINSAIIFEWQSPK